MFQKKKKKTIQIEGMHCMHCAKKVEEALQSLEEIKKAKVNLKTQEALIQFDHEIDEQKIKERIEDLGYHVIQIQ